MKRIFTLLFTISYLGVLFFSCQKEFSSETGNTQVASGSLVTDSLGNCMPDTVVGTFYDGVTPGSDTAYVEIQVNVTQTGAYSIYTDFPNGFQFADSGIFTTTGINTVRLKPLGTPIIPVPTTFNVSFDSSFCSFIVDVKDSTGTGLGGGQDTVGNGDPDGGMGNWQFNTDSGLTAKGTFDSVLFSLDPVYGGSILLMAGYTSNNDSIINLVVHFPTNTITTGTYNTQVTTNTSAAIFAFGLVSTGNSIYEALDNPGDGTNVALTISSYDASTRTVTGTFSGIALDDAYDPATIGIKNGSFTATVQ
jgi:hypothetical protein